jgi:IS4 transposase
MAANIKHELAGIDLGDARRDRRIGRLAARMAASPMASIRAACSGWAEAIAGFRLLHSPCVTAEKILDVHESATLGRAGLSRRLLLVQDTTELDYTSHKALKGAGRLDKETRRGFYAHSRLLVDEDTGIPLGLCSSHIRTRDLETKDSKHKQVPFDEKESHRWFEGYLKGCALAEAQPRCEVIVVGDRESDIYEIYAEQQRRAQAGEPFAHLLVRAGRDRALMETEETKETKEAAAAHLFETARQGGKLGTYQVEVGDKDQIRKVKGNKRVTHREGRKATLQVRVARVTLRPPHRKHGEALPAVALRVLSVVEIDPPAGQEPIEWILLTSQTVETFAQAKRLIDAYSLRWRIEEFHRVLKSGCRVEQINLRDADSLLPALALYFIVAWRILFLRDFRRAQPALCCSNLFSADEWRAACIIHGRPVGREPPTLAEMIDMVGKTGGHMGRKNDPSPGPECLWRGLAKLQCYVEMGRALGAL